MAAKLRKDGDEVELEKGTLGELSVEADGRKLFDSNRKWVLSPGAVVKRVKAARQS